MSGSTVDAMADAIDHSHTVLYAVSLEYKESANCKLECMYAHSAGVEMIPMMLQDNFKANGWLGMMLGTRLWCVAMQPHTWLRSTWPPAHNMPVACPRPTPECIALAC